MLTPTFLAFFRQATQSETPTWFSMVPIVVFFLIFYFLVLRPQIRQQKDQKNLLDNLKKGDKVITGGGIWGEIDALDAGTIKLKINEKTKITVTRSAISGLQPGAGAAEGDKR